MEEDESQLQHDIDLISSSQDDQDVHQDVHRDVDSEDDLQIILNLAKKSRLEATRKPVLTALLDILYSHGDDIKIDHPNILTLQLF